MEMETKRRGPIKRLPQTRRYTMMLIPADVEWGKNTPEGLSALVRRLMRQERERAEEKRAA